MDQKPSSWPWLSTLGSFRFYSWPLILQMLMINLSSGNETKCTEGSGTTAGANNLTAIIQRRPVPTELRLGTYSECRWILDLSTSRDPYRVSTTYFNEREAWDVKDQLEEPDTIRFLRPVTVDKDTKSYNVFPYFVIIRGVCDDSPYSDQYYHLISQQGYRPNIRIVYVPVTSRVVHADSIRISFMGALIDLIPDVENQIVPVNPNCVTHTEGASSDSTSDPICHPAFAVPMVLLNIPIFLIEIDAFGPFRSLAQNVYLTPFHSRQREGVGQVILAHQFQCNETNTTATPGSNVTLTNTPRISTMVKATYFFPSERIGLGDLGTNRTPGESVTEALRRMGKTLEDYLNETKTLLTKADMDTLHDANPRGDFPFEGPFHPLDSDDFFTPQYTFGSAPTVAIAGFYRPDLILLADPDMNSINLFKWEYNTDTNGTIFDHHLSCQLEDNVGGFIRPMYARGQRVGNEIVRHHRHRYHPMNYSDTSTASHTKEGHGIFEIIGMEDRLLILTTSGLVSFHGITNVTVEKDRVLKAYDDEKRRYCYKFVNILNVALIDKDPIVAVTETYDQSFVDENNQTIRDPVDQEVHYATLGLPGIPLQWVSIGKNEFSDRDVLTPESGSATGHKVQQQDLSEAHKICNEVHGNFLKPLIVDPSVAEIEFILKESKSGSTVESDLCTIIDGSAIPTRPDTVLLMVFMTFTYFKDPTCSQSPRREEIECDPFDKELCLSADVADRNVSCNFRVQKMHYYIFAEHTVKKVILEGSTWEIVGIIAQIPCDANHLESVKNLRPFDKSFLGIDQGEVSCTEENIHNHKLHLQLTRMTFTRKVSNHLYVYGNRLLHSTDTGQNFILSRSFPHQDNFIDEAGKSNLEKYELIELGHRHHIRIMAFASNTQFAFLTNKRELWIGTSGAQVQNRIRPSPGYSLRQLSLYNELGVNEGIPISLMFDAFNVLFELVAIRNATTGEIEDIVKRVVHFEITQRNNFLLEQLERIKDKAIVDSIRDGKTETIVQHEVRDVSLICAFNSFETNQNYTATLSRLQVFSTAPPFQHLALGVPAIKPTLMAYQVAIFTLIHESFLTSPDNFYSRVERDPFILWNKESGDSAFIGYVKYYKDDSKKHGIVVDPRRSARQVGNVSTNRFISEYYMDYGTTVELVLTFFIKASYLLARTDFQRQRLDLIQLNVDNADSSIVTCTTSRESISKHASVKFTNWISLVPNSTLRQSVSGAGLLPIPLTFHMIDAFGKCFNLPHWGMVGNALTINVLAGCPPATDLLFDWTHSLQSLRFRHKNLKYGESDECHNGDRVCFYAREQVVLFFDKLDKAKQRYEPFTGKYKMRVIGGSYKDRDDSFSVYNNEEQEAFNIPGQSDVSLIWTIAPPEAGEKDVQEFDVTKDPNTQETILESGLSRIKWACNTLSPCARIAPMITGRTVFYFKINVSNRGIVQDTLCLHERSIIIQIYGFPPSPEILILATLFSAIIILMLLYLMYYCFRGHRKVWRSQKLKIWGWLQIVTDTFPKPLKNRAGIDEKEQLRKDSLLLSLQGHLRVPSLLHKPRRQRQASQGLSVSTKSSPSSSKSSLTSQNSSEILLQVNPRKAAATWTEMVYEQIISRRLLAIVERNKRMRDAIIRKVQSKATEEEKAKQKVKEKQKKSGDKQDKQDKPNPK